MTLILYAALQCSEPHCTMLSTMRSLNKDNSQHHIVTWILKSNNICTGICFEKHPNCPERPICQISDTSSGAAVLGSADVYARQTLVQQVRNIPMGRVRHGPLGRCPQPPPPPMFSSTALVCLNHQTTYFSSYHLNITATLTLLAT